MMSTPSFPRAPTPEKPTLYFAYGSNLSLAQMKSRCPGSTYVGMGVLPGYRWIINQRGYANIIFCEGPGPQSGEGENSESGMMGAAKGDTRASTFPLPSPAETHPQNIESKSDSNLIDTVKDAFENAINRNQHKKHLTTTTTTTTTPNLPQKSQPPSQNAVYGLLYTLTRADESALDTSEGVPFAYTKTYPLITLLSISADPPASPATSPFPIFLITLPASPSPSPSPPTPSQIPLHSPISTTSSSLPQPIKIQALTYIDTRRTTPSSPKPEYITRMNRGIRDALSKGFAPSYVRDVMRVYIPACETGGGLRRPFTEELEMFSKR